MEPNTKRQKIEYNYTVTAKAVMSAELEKEVSLTTVYVSKIANKQQISLIMQELCRVLPLPTCQHLKRVRQNEIILCRAEDLEENKSLDEFLKRTTISPDVLAALCEHVYKVQVPATAPLLRWQYEAMQQHWPSKFHANKYLESIYAGSNFSESDKKFHSRIVNLLLRLSLELAAGKPFGICIDPRTNSIVTMCASQVELHPLMHCPMVLVDFVARSQHAGAWNGRWEEDFMTDTSKDGKATLAGVPKRYFNFVQQQHDYQDLKFGAEQLRMTKDVPPAENAADNLSKYGPYLCTGYDVYLSTEPCLMCAMALIHSRVRCIFFVHPSQENGALISRFKLHTAKELNHHYEVFLCQLNNQTADHTT